MIVGHAGLALLAKWRATRVELGWLAVAAYLPDAVRAVLVPMIGLEYANVASHSVPGVMVLSLLLGILRVALGAPVATGVWLGVVCMSHWPADLFTACKPTWPGGPVVGWAAYERPGWDLAIELGLFVVGWRLTSEHVPAMRRLGIVRAAAIAGALQLAVLATFARNSWIRVGGEHWGWRGVATFVDMGPAGSSCAVQPRIGS